MIIIRRGEKINKKQQNSIEQEKKLATRKYRNTGRWKHQQGLERKTRTTSRNSRGKKTETKEDNIEQEETSSQETTNNVQTRNRQNSKKTKITKNSKENKENTNNKQQQARNNKEIKEQQQIIRTKISSFTMSSQKFKI